MFSRSNLAIRGKGDLLGRRLFAFVPDSLLIGAGNGLFLKHDHPTASYAIILHNIRTYQSGGVLAVVRGKKSAASKLRNFEDSQDSSDRHEGWRYFMEKTDLQAGMDPIEATQHRQAELERRESKPLREA
jgi:hypothetical protein